MRPEEEFVSHSLVAFFGEETSVSAVVGDPPDFYLTVNDSRIGVEVTRLFPFTVEESGTPRERNNEDSFGVQLLDDLNKTLSLSIPQNLCLLIGLEMPVAKGAKFKKKLTRWIAQIAVAPLLGARYETTIDDSKATISVIPERSTGKKIVGFVSNRNSVTDIVENARLTLENSIKKKIERCASCEKPIWLALLNEYWLADASTYDIAAQKISITHCFERIFIVSRNATVTEIFVGTYSIPSEGAPG